ncbi:hypothetical protein PGT21_001179 [Puccinia graminis f. sp. tritici]|uniref:Uncharacterized protein n=1 Tax=Puccinia graminis f. sp. tritici TaxID=56615 RepID=A0A5B0NEN2_PUCGR|nr:hypothetical protein PGT21_001179 [Puccinia graminis f. sp. tritici]
MSDSSSTARRNPFELNLNLNNSNNNHNYYQQQQQRQEQQHQLPNLIIKPIRTLLAFLLHLIFNLNQFYLIRPTPIPVSSSTNPLNSALLPSSSISNRTHHQLTSINHPNNNQRSAILITNNSELNPLSLQLALNFAAIGYHIFIQVSSHSQLTQVIIRWQRLKSTLINHHHHPSTILRTHSNSKSTHPPSPIGTIIPLLYLTHHLSQRLEAISTISAYLQENQIDMISLINIIDPYRIRKSSPTHHHPFNNYSPLSPTFPFNHTNHQSHPSASSSPSISCRPLTGISSPSATSEQSNNIHSPSTPRSLPMSSSTGSSNQELYNPQPLPLSISSENYLLDAYADLILGPLSTTQDLLLLLKDHRGRVLNIWDGHRHPQSAIIDLMLGGFHKINKVLKDELQPLQIPVSIIYRPPGNTLNLQTRTTQSIVTRDSRSLLSEASDIDLLHLFTKQTAEVLAKEASNLQNGSDPDLKPTFDLVRSVLETNYPCPVYPIGIKEVIGQITHLSGLEGSFSRLERLLGF